MERKLHLGLFLFLAFFSGLSAQPFSGGYQFSLPPFQTPDSPYWPSFFHEPIGSADSIRINADGHFTRNDEPIRFFGTNIVAGAAFTDFTSMAGVAERLSGMGYNLVRFHHLDNPWDSDGNIFSGQSHTLSLNQQRLNELEFFIYQLKQNGVYVNMNLHVSRTFREEDGVAGADSIPNFGKGVTLFDPQLIQLQKDYAQQLLSHINPYTGLSLAEDPVLAMVEIANENSLYRMWKDGKLKPFAHGGDLMVRHDAMLDSLWLGYLSERYENDAALTQSWNQGLTEGSNQLENGGFESGDGPGVPLPWQFSLYDNAGGVVVRDSQNPYEGGFSLRAVIMEITDTDWHIQLTHPDLMLVEGELYQVNFAARSESDREISISIQQSVGPYEYYTGSSFDITTEWSEFSFAFTSPVTSDGDVHLGFVLGQSTHDVWLDAVSLGEPQVFGLLPEESLEGGTVRRTDFNESASFTESRIRDISGFYLDTMRGYFTEMSAYIKDVLGVRAPLSGTNWSVGVPDFYAQSVTDYMDNHAYWDHPSFPNEPWSPVDWLINNSAMVQSTDGGAVAGALAGARLAGKPLTVSEYNHPFPNRYQSEGVLFLTAYSAFQEADGLMFYSFNGSDSWETDMVESYFDHHRNTAMMSLMPSCALAYRSGMIQPAEQQLDISYHPDDFLLWAREFSGWSGPQVFDRRLILEHQIVIDTFDHPFPDDHGNLPPVSGNPHQTDTGEIIWNQDGLLTVASPQFIGLTGMLNQFPNTVLDDFRLLQASDFATVTWVSVTGDPLSECEYSLLTVSTRIQNTDMIWDGIQTIHNNWGSAPTEMHPVSLSFEFTSTADSVLVVPLDPNGMEMTEGIILNPSETGSFLVEIDQENWSSPWFGIHQYHILTGDVNSDDQVDVLDAVLLVSFILGLLEPSDTQWESADLNQDGQLDVLDVVLLVEVILG